MTDILRIVKSQAQRPLIACMESAHNHGRTPDLLKSSTSRTNPISSSPSSSSLMPSEVRLEELSSAGSEATTPTTTLVSLLSTTSSDAIMGHPQGAKAPSLVSRPVSQECPGDATPSSILVPRTLTNALPLTPTSPDSIRIHQHTPPTHPLPHAASAEPPLDSFCCAPLTELPEMKTPCGKRFRIPPVLECPDAPRKAPRRACVPAPRLRSLMRSLDFSALDEPPTPPTLAL